jgi:hypothetical protein
MGFLVAQLHSELTDTATLNLRQVAAHMSLNCMDRLTGI